MFVKIRLVVKTALFFIILLAAAIVAAAQPQPSPSPSPSPTPVDIVYTGKFIGYLRVPSIQDFKATGCPANPKPSDAAEKFLELRDSQVAEKTVLLGTGDNFSPELEARVFSNVPPTGDKYTVANKELYLGSKDGWVFYKEDSPRRKALQKIHTEGLGVIPSDNVACFLRRAGYAAIVPGKHDFYFGAERVRELARFLAADQSGVYTPVQMLGANMVMKTGPIESTTVSEKIKEDRSFVDWPSEYPVINVSDGKSVYPWFSIFKIKLLDLSKKPTFLPAIENHIPEKGFRTVSDFADFISKQPENKTLTDLKTTLKPITTGDGIRICESLRTQGKSGEPNELPDKLSDCDKPRDMEIRRTKDAVLLYVYPQKKYETDKKHGAGKHFSSFEFGRNFGLCLHTTEPKGDKNGNACLRFSSHTPFFYFPHKVPNEKSQGFVDPEPYVIKNNVAIFGVVDPTLGEHVGILNFGWTHEHDSDLTTRLSIEDPNEALQQQLDYFAIQHPNFTGMKVLLAQMTPQRAKALAAKFPEFQIVVSAADREQATSNIKMSTNWNPALESFGQFLAVPAPYFNSASRKGSVHIGTINAKPSNPTDPKKTAWELSAEAFPGKPVDHSNDPATSFWDAVKKLPECLPSKFPRKSPDENFDNQDYLKWLVLCAMQQHLGADAALIQTRDLFEQIPLLNEKMVNREKELSNQSANAKEAKADGKKTENLEKEVLPEELWGNVQQMLDRLVWKGDLVTLLHVPGSALKKALEQSETYEAAEAATLSLSVERGRKLETLGIRKEKGEYFINGLPLEDARLYSIATTDFIGAGDTGYPDLVKATRNPRVHPAAFTGDLIAISSLVCRKLFVNEVNSEKYCLGPIDSRQYLDATIVQQIPPYPNESAFSKAWTATGFAWPDKRKVTHSPADGLEQRVHRRRFWGFSLKNISFGFKDLDNNRTDDSVEEKFVGIPTSGLTSKETRNISFGLDMRLSYFADRFEYFVANGIEYDKQEQGDPLRDSGITQNKNRLFGTIGFVGWRRPGREFPNYGFTSSLRLETQLATPFSGFALATGNDDDQIPIRRRRGLLLLVRPVGFRWQSKTNTFEIAGQWGREFRALKGYHFENPGTTPVECLVEATKTVAACIEENSKPPDGKITVNSVATAMLHARPRAGIYGEHTFSVPLHTRLKYELTQDADWFFVNFSGDTPVDTQFRYNGKHRLSIMIWSNLSIGPTVDLFMYQNKVNGNFLFQRTIGIETKFSFDVFNRREKQSQVIARP